jgi:RNA polymerase sigma-70 factor (ECF subfamily)
MSQDQLPSETPTTAADDEAFVAALRARSEDAWTALYDTCYQFIYRYALVRTSNVSVSEDLAASVFLEALKSIAAYRHRGRPVLAWLYAIARNVLSDYHKSSRPANELRQARTALSRGPCVPLGQPGDAAARQSSPEASVDRLDIMQALNRLKHGQREVIILHYYLGLTIPEAAAFLGKRERAVYSMHARAIAKLREFLSAPQTISAKTSSLRAPSG